MLVFDVVCYVCSFFLPNIIVDIIFYFYFLVVPFGLLQLIKTDLLTIRQYEMENLRQNDRGRFGRMQLLFANRLAIF